MRYSEDVIEEVRMKNDIVDVIGGYLPLKASEKGKQLLWPLSFPQ